MTEMKLILRFSLSRITFLSVWLSVYLIYRFKFVALEYNIGTRTSDLELMWLSIFSVSSFMFFAHPKMIQIRRFINDSLSHFLDKLLIVAHALTDLINMDFTYVASWVLFSFIDWYHDSLQLIKKDSRHRCNSIQIIVASPFHCLMFSRISISYESYLVSLRFAPFISSVIYRLSSLWSRICTIFT